LTELNRTEFII